VDNQLIQNPNLGVLKLFEFQQPTSERRLEIENNGQKFVILISSGLIESTTVAPKALMLFRDITDEDRRKNLQKTFIRIVGHELKQPLGLIKAHTYYLKRLFNNQKLSPEIDYIKKIENQVDIIAQIFNDIADATRFSLQTFSISTESTDIMQQLVKSVEALRLIYPNREINLPDINQVKVNCLIDPIRTQQVFTNVITNAIKYSPENSPVDISVKLWQKKFEIKITDYGHGIEKNELKKIFEPYFRSQATKKNHAKGLGLGLSFVANIMTRQNGGVSVKSQLGKGSTFKLSFPLET
jgi:signal transduction histidine kinase